MPQLDPIVLTGLGIGGSLLLLFVYTAVAAVARTVMTLAAVASSVALVGTLLIWRGVIAWPFG